MPNSSSSLGKLQPAPPLWAHLTPPTPTPLHNLSKPLAEPHRDLCFPWQAGPLCFLSCDEWAEKPLSCFFPCLESFMPLNLRVVNFLVCVSCLVMSDSLRPHQAPLSMGFSRQDHWSGLPFPSPKRSIERKKVKSLSCVWLFAIPSWTVCSLPGSSIHGIFQARVLEWVAISFSRSQVKCHLNGMGGSSCPLNEGCLHLPSLSRPLAPMSFSLLYNHMSGWNLLSADYLAHWDGSSDWKAVSCLWSF